jgi:hypothetical protein
MQKCNNCVTYINCACIILFHAGEINIFATDLQANNPNYAVIKNVSKFELSGRFLICESALKKYRFDPMTYRRIKLEKKINEYCGL